MSNNVQRILFEEIITLLDPIIGAANSEESLKKFFLNMGWNFDADSGMPLINITSNVSQISQLIERFREAIDEGGIESLEKAFALLNSSRIIFERLEELVEFFNESELTEDQANEVVQEMLQYLPARYLLGKNHFLVEVLRWIEVIKVKKGAETIFNSSAKIIRYPFAFEVIDFANIGIFINNPVQAIKDIYFAPFDKNTEDGAEDFTDKLFPRIGSIADAFGAVYVYGTKREYGIDFGSLGNKMARGALTLMWKQPLDDSSFGLTIAYSPKIWGDLGWVIVPFGEFTFEKVFGKYLIQVKSTLQVGGIIINDEGDVKFEGDLTKVNAVLSALKLSDNANGVSYLIGEKEGTRLELGKVSIGSSFEATITTGLFFDIHLAIDEAKFVLSANGQDGFIAKILPEKGVEIPFAFLLGYSTKKRLYFGVNAGLSLSLPVHINAFGLKVDEVHLKIKAQDDGLKGEASLSGGVNLGPIKISFEEIGLQAKFDWTKTQKNIGFTDLSLDFKSPNGAGISLDVEFIKGGGFLKFDPDRQEYSGALKFVFNEKITLDAFGLITTRMPDGSKGFSLLIIFTAGFGTGIQLGFGFTLLAVGGLLGLNRMVNLEALQQGIRTGAIENVLFPKDIIANAPRILSDLQRFFPAAQNQFLVGPMAKIGWGTPPLIKASIGLILELPDATIRILGVVKITLPDEKAAILKLQSNFIGRIEPQNKRLWFYAELLESRVLSFALSGSMGLLLHWGDQPNFVISIGGFHPKYSPPPLPFPVPPRFTVNILNESFAKVLVDGYFAVTSNTVQFGARVEVFFGLSKFRVEGDFSADTLFQFNPFYCILELSASLSVKVFGVGLYSVGFKGFLEGPAPWHIKGKGRISFWFFKISVPFEHTWGESRTTTLPPLEVLPLVKKEFNDLSNWEAVLPAGSRLLVTLRKLGTEAADALVLHPVGYLRISQRKIPLDLVLDKVGHQKPGDFNKVWVMAKGAWQSVGTAQELFAIGQFRDLDVTQRLSTPGFQYENSGLKLLPAGDQLRTSKAVKRIIRYETKIVDNYKRDDIKSYQYLRPGYDSLYGTLFDHYLEGSAVSQSVLSRSYRKQVLPFEQVIQVLPDKYAVAYIHNNQFLNNTAMQFNSQADADEFLLRQLEIDPNLAESLHVIPVTEINS